MTVLADVSWPGEVMIDCDHPGCSMHIHLGKPKEDPRLSKWLQGWKLDVDGGKDYCPDHALQTVKTAS